MKSISLLYVDDDEIDRLWFERVAKKHENLTTKTMEQFPTIEVTNNFDFILIDHNLPHTSRSLISRLAEQKNIIIVSGEPLSDYIFSKTAIDDILANLIRYNYINIKGFEEIFPKGTTEFEELISITIKGLKARKQVLNRMSNDSNALLDILHKTNSTFLHCGICNNAVSKLKDTILKEQENNHVVFELTKIINRQIDLSIEELRTNLTKSSSI